VVNRLGFIETPYRKVINSNGKPKVSKTIEFLSADDEDRTFIAQANSPMDGEGFISTDQVQVRIRGDFPMRNTEEVSYMDVSPLQIVSPAAACIPFLEHDDANRALMGSNMQRQSVPLLWPEAPIVGTGFEKIVAKDSRSLLLSDVKGIVKSVSAEEILIKTTRRIDEDVTLIEEPGMVSYKLRKYQRSNQDSCINQKVLVEVGQRVAPGDVLADGMSTDRGDLALGRNITVAFMPWRGYNFEDAIVLSERLLKEDVFTSMRLKEVELEVRETKRGEEELTRDIPNVSEEATRNLSNDGIIRVGAEVHPGDTLIGKVTPKGETDPTPEEKLLKAIFGEKAGDVKDASKRADPGVKGVVIRTELYTRKGRESRIEEKRKLDALKQRASLDKTSLTKKRNEKVNGLLLEQKSANVMDLGGKIILKSGTPFTKEAIATLNFERVDRREPIALDEDIDAKLNKLLNEYERLYREIEQNYENDVYKQKVGDDLQPGVIQLAKVQIATKRKISIGDKMAGRHGNKGVVAAIVAEEDMPFLPDGRPVDIVLNPLGVPSRMNLGQLYETMLGWAGRELGVMFETPVFDGATLADVEGLMKKANLPVGGKVELIDGRTGEYIENPVAVGEIYMMKLTHQVDDKMHARSTGPYSLITQQPLGGKAQFGGQRFGEMEVWALEAYGAAHTLQEMLTVKSDDVEGRSKVYNALVKGENLPEFGIPESFNVLLREMKGLGLDVELK
jgi:DNA-directed RNA polymerase subunit beta